MGKYVVNVDYNTEGWMKIEVDAENQEEAEKLACAKVRLALLDPPALGPVHTPVNVKTRVDPD